MFLKGAALLLLLVLIQVVLCAEDYYKVRLLHLVVPNAMLTSHKILELDRQASDKQIKSAYKRLSKKFHPDKNP